MIAWFMVEKTRPGHYNPGMKFAELAEDLEKLEGTSSRLEMTKILAEMFAKVDPEEGKILAYLSAGSLGPKYNNPDMGMAEKQVLKAVALAVGENEEKVTSEFKRAGDVGKAVKILKKETDHGKQLEVKQISERLLEIARESGTGSQGKKIELMAKLINDVNAQSAKYAVKISLGKMRSGFSDMTVLDSLSWMIKGDKSLREKIEDIYNVRADLGEVVKIIKKTSGDIEKIKVDPVIGTPILVARAERAKNPQEIEERMGGESAAEHKLDGLRIEAHIQKDQVILFSRGMENVTSMYPDIVEGLKQQVHDDCILDGEMIAVGKDGKYLPFQETVQRKRKYDILEMMSQIPLKYYTFDILSLNGKNMLNTANRERRKILEKVVRGDGKDIVRLMPRKIVKTAEEIEKYFREALALGTEGVVIKKLDSIYQSGSRDFNWIKYKKSYDETGVADTIDAVVMGYDAGEGKRQVFGIGGFLIGVQKGESGKFQTIAKIGTGLSDEEWRELKKRCDEIKTAEKSEDYEVTRAMLCDVWVKPKIVVEIKCDEITKSPMHSSGLALRFPRLVSFRELKPEEAATTAEIKRLFELQKKE